MRAAGARFYRHSPHSRRQKSPGHHRTRWTIPNGRIIEATGGLWATQELAQGRFRGKHQCKEDPNTCSQVSSHAVAYQPKGSHSKSTATNLESLIPIAQRLSLFLLLHKNHVKNSMCTTRFILCTPQHPGTKMARLGLWHNRAHPLRTSPL